MTQLSSISITHAWSGIGGRRQRQGRRRISRDLPGFPSLTCQPEALNPSALRVFIARLEHSIAGLHLINTFTDYSRFWVVVHRIVESPMAWFPDAAAALPGNPDDHESARPRRDQSPL